VTVDGEHPVMRAKSDFVISFGISHLVQKRFGSESVSLLCGRDHKPQTGGVLLQYLFDRSEVGAGWSPVPTTPGGFDLEDVDIITRAPVPHGD
jgi:hypothetical protein